MKRIKDMKIKKEIPFLIANLGCHISSLILKYFFSLIIVVGVLYVLAYMTVNSFGRNGSNYNRDVIANTVWFLQLIGYVGMFGLWSITKMTGFNLNLLPEDLLEAEIYQGRSEKKIMIADLIIKWGLNIVSVLISCLVHSYFIIWAFSKEDCMKYMLIYCVAVVLTYVVFNICCNTFRYSWKQFRFIDDERYRKIEISIIQKYLEENHWRLVEAKANGTYEYKHPCCPKGMEVMIPQLKEHEDYYSLISNIIPVLEFTANKTKPIQTPPTKKGIFCKHIIKNRKFPESVLAEIIKLEQEETKKNETV